MGCWVFSRGYLKCVAADKLRTLRNLGVCCSRHLEWALWALTLLFQHLGWQLCGVNHVVASQTFRRWKQAECTTISPRAICCIVPWTCSKLSLLHITSVPYLSVHVGFTEVCWFGKFGTTGLPLEVQVLVEPNGWSSMLPCYDIEGGPYAFLERSKSPSRLVVSKLERAAGLWWSSDRFPSHPASLKTNSMRNF